MNLDTKLLIDQVKGRTHLWNPAHPEYRLREVRNESWREICTTLITDFDKMDGKTQQKTMQKVRTRWKTARDSYIKVENKHKESEKKNRARSSNYLQQLSFLKQILKRKAEDDSDGMVSVEDDSSSQSVPTVKREEAEAAKMNDNVVEHMEVTTSACEGIAMPSKHTRKEEDDDNHSFLMSLLPMIRKLDEDQKLSFRLEVLQSVIRIKNTNSVLS